MSGRLMCALAGDAELLPQDAQMLAQPQVGGVILFARNFHCSRQLRQLTASIRRAAARPLLIAADQEGGRVQRFSADGFTRVPPMAQLAAGAAAAQRVRAAGIVLGAELRAHGLDLTFAPVLDIAHGNSAIIGDRAFAAQGEAAAALALQLAQGLAQAGLPACGKHFPGHGFVAADSHQQLPRDERPRAQLRADWQPFARFAEAGGELLMTAHIVYAQVDAAAAATFSSRWLREILRGELGYRGLVVSDDLCMAAAVQQGDIGARLHAAAAAGCDLLLQCDPQENAAAVQAAAQLPSGGAAWQQLLRPQSAAHIGVGDAACADARRQLIAAAA